MKTQTQGHEKYLVVYTIFTVTVLIAVLLIVNGCPDHLLPDSLYC